MMLRATFLVTAALRDGILVVHQYKKKNSRINTQAVLSVSHSFMFYLCIAVECCDASEDIPG